MKATTVLIVLALAVVACGGGGLAPVFTDVVGAIEDACSCTVSGD